MDIRERAKFYLARKSLAEQKTLIEQETIDRYRDENITVDDLIKLGFVSKPEESE